MPTDRSTVYIGGAYEKNSDGSVVKYYGALGRTIAMRQVPAGGGQGTVYYLLTDHLGSASTITNDVGTVVSSQKYWPYGGTRSGSITQTDKLYTGQQQEPGDSALGLYNYKARFYSTTLGRFVSVDPIGGSVSDPQAWNPYSYVRDNPLRYTDPTGRRWTDIVKSVVVVVCYCPPPDDFEIPAIGPVNPQFNPNIVDNWERHWDSTIEPVVGAVQDLFSSDEIEVPDEIRNKENELSDERIEGAAIEAAGGTTGDNPRTGKPYNHQEVVQNALRGLDNELDAIDKELAKPLANISERTRLEVLRDYVEGVREKSWTKYFEALLRETSKRHE